MGKQAFIYLQYQKSLLIFSICLHSHLTIAQVEKKDFVSVKISQTVLEEFHYKEKPKRKLLNLEHAKWSTKLNPLTYLAVGLMYGYQNVLSEQISANCTYQISCSEMTKKSIEKYGLIKGTLFGLHQLTNCSRSILKDHCEHVISPDNKIINQVE